MTVILFAGPTLARRAEIALPADFLVRPPAQAGDVYRAAAARPRAIGIVDGYFEGVPSVWHKEILFAMSRGIAVFGSASIGALRAAELHIYGMVGVGEIFAAYRDGALDSDDEVALLHGPEETGFAPLTEPLVNVRATCRAAKVEDVIDGSEAEMIVAAARSIFYKERTWREIGMQAARSGLSEDRLARFTAWLPPGRVDRKRLDALAMIERMRADLDHPLAVEHDFEPTFLWERAVAGWTRQEPDPRQPASDPDGAVLDELRLDPERYLSLKMRARLRMESLRKVGAGSPPLTQSERAATRKRHRIAHGLLRAADLDRWLGGQALERAEYDRLIEESAVADVVVASEDAELHRHMLALLKLDGEFAAARQRAAAKAETLRVGGSKAEAGRPVPPVLVEWYFRRLGREVPEDIDRLVRDLGLASREDFYRLLAEEHIYSAASDERRPA